MTNYDKSIGSALADMVLNLGEIKAEVVELTHERDEEHERATAAERKYTGLEKVYDLMCSTLTRERDEARAAVKMLTDDLRECTDARLRAAQQLPDVGPVTRDEDGTICVDGYDFVDSDLPHNPQLIRSAAARTLAVAAFLDAEADNTSSDDEVSWPIQRLLGKDLFDVGLTSVGPDDLDNGQLAERLVALGWTRARGGQEAGQ